MLPETFSIYQTSTATQATADPPWRVFGTIPGVVVLAGPVQAPRKPLERSPAQDVQEDVPGGQERKASRHGRPANRKTLPLPPLAFLSEVRHLVDVHYGDGLPIDEATIRRMYHRGKTARETMESVAEFEGWTPLR